MVAFLSVNRRSNRSPFTPNSMIYQMHRGAYCNFSMLYLTYQKFILHMALQTCLDERKRFRAMNTAPDFAAFDAGTFRELANSPLGRDLWAFLNEHDNLVRMETATYLERPAVEPLSPGLLQCFGNDVRQDRVKQMIGRMVRQILEGRGCRIDRQNVRIPAQANMFASGTRYTADWSRKDVAA